MSEFEGLVILLLSAQFVVLLLIMINTDKTVGWLNIIQAHMRRK